MNFLSRHKSVAIFLMGAMAVISFVLLAGADSTQLVGRYRMSVVVQSSFTHIYIIDTVTGVVKYAGKDEGKPFEAITGK